MYHFLIFAGTTEGKQLLELLAPHRCMLTACVATEYGEEVLPEHPNLTVLAGRRDSPQIAQLLGEQHFDCVFDATHPYATAVTENIRTACAATGTPYLRVLREQSTVQNCTYVQSAAEAAAYLSQVDGNVLLTTGSKELDCFTAVPGYAARLFPRVLPTPDSLARCIDLGFAAKNIICMQGPFNTELNVATLKQIGATCLVTKDSGGAGGFLEKCEAARIEGAQLLVIGRPLQIQGVSLLELPLVLEQRYGFVQSKSPAQQPDVSFPLFISLRGKTVTVVGAGNIAARRINTLLHFGCEVKVISPSANGQVQALADAKQITLLLREYKYGDCTGSALAVAATDNRTANHMVYEECTAEQIPVSVADCKAECSFYFPGIVQSGSAVIGVTASGTDHRLAKKITENIRNHIDNMING
ncbi:precorrin-6A reductase [Hydrogenoanaerobacterium sp.]|uniref:precorrin-6A reductase n=1 Tax=Hydrogenoanaerobacterium sp. TaxID=2953763 RepID=UPI00289DABEB|nr:precorrin-6A reductase [Hydrogenoanaerobacterium sp.]